MRLLLEFCSVCTFKSCCCRLLLCTFAVLFSSLDSVTSCGFVGKLYITRSLYRFRDNLHRRGGTSAVSPRCPTDRLLRILVIPKWFAPCDKMCVSVDIMTGPPGWTTTTPQLFLVFACQNTAVRVVCSGCESQFARQSAFLELHSGVALHPRTERFNVMAR